MFSLLAIVVCTLPLKEEECANFLLPLGLLFVPPLALITISHKLGKYFFCELLP